MTSRPKTDDADDARGDLENALTDIWGVAKVF
jgi:hypothetical protein